ncbi:uncharacterized protein [Palaemon carinicauda]|uniref:uncharacterized protein n=1 Tax=Palaemon carinicauda TaxID=392227 RepID=UPI0035B5B90A
MYLSFDKAAHYPPLAHAPTNDLYSHFLTPICRNYATTTPDLGGAAKKCANSWWMVRFGIPEHIAFDRATTFTSQLWISLANLLGINLHQSTAYNLAANRIVECFYCNLKASLMFCCKDSSWFTQLPWVFLGLWTTPKDALDVSATEIVYGDPLVVLLNFFPSATSSGYLQRLRHMMGKFTPCRQTYKPLGKQCIPIDLHSATHVFLHNETSKPPLMPSYMGPLVMIHLNPKAFLITFMIFVYTSRLTGPV